MVAIALPSYIKQVAEETADQDAFYEVICECCGGSDGCGYTPDEALENASNNGVRRITDLTRRELVLCSECI